MKILIVDDDPLSQLTLRATLAPFGECVCAGNGEVGIAVGDWAHPTLETNNCLGNAMAAVAFPDPTANPERDDVYSKLAEWGRPWTRRALRLPTAVPEPPKEDGPSRRES